MEKQARERRCSLPPGASGGEVSGSPRLLTSHEAARTLAVSERTLFSITKRGELRSVRLGRSVRYDAADLADLIARAKQSGGVR